MRDRGATILEFALVSVALFAIIFIVIEGAFAVRARSTMANAIDDAARRGAVAGSAPDADYQILFQLFGRGANTVGDVQHVTIFKGDAGNAQVTTDCMNGIPDTDVCNVYTAGVMFDGNGAFIDNPALYGCPNAWCSTTRGQNLTGSLEFIGVYVKADYRTILQGVFTDKFTVNVSGQALQAIETSEKAP